MKLRSFPGYRYKGEYREVIEKIIEDATGYHITLIEGTKNFQFETPCSSQIGFDIDGTNGLFYFKPIDIRLCGLAVIQSIEMQTMYAPKFTKVVKDFQVGDSVPWKDYFEIIKLFLEHYVYNRAIYTFQGEGRLTTMLKQCGFEEASRYFNPYHTDDPLAVTENRVVLKFEMEYER